MGRVSGGPLLKKEEALSWHTRSKDKLDKTWTVYTQYGPIIDVPPGSRTACLNWSLWEVQIFSINWGFNNPTDDSDALVLEPQPYKDLSMPRVNHLSTSCTILSLETQIQICSLNGSYLLFEQSEEVISVNLTKFSPNKDFSTASQWILGTW